MENGVVAVTGSASGIGRACVDRFAADGWRVGVIDVDPTTDQPGDSIQAADVRDAGQVSAAIDGVARDLGRLDALVCCAGVVRPGTVTETTLDDWQLQFDVNVLGTMLSARAAIPHLRASGGGAIVTIASNLALVAEPGVPGYCASKAAVLGLTRAMALDHIDEGIRVNAVCPGPTRTPMVQQFIDSSPDPAAAERESASTQLHGRLIDPAEIAAAVCYLASPDSGSTIGAALVVDGGYTVR